MSTAKTAFVGGWGKAEGKGGCATTGDETTIENKVDAHQTDLESALEVTGTTPSKCTAAKFKAAGKKGACKLGCSAKAALKNLPLSDPTVMACLSACSTKFSAAFTKAEVKGGCRTTGDTGTVEGTSTHSSPTSRANCRPVGEPRRPRRAPPRRPRHRHATSQRRDRRRAGTAAER